MTVCLATQALLAHHCDLALAGGKLHARFVAHRCGHTLNNRLLHALFADSTAWRLISAEPASRRDFGFARAA